MYNRKNYIYAILINILLFVSIYSSATLFAEALPTNRALDDSNNLGILPTSSITQRGVLGILNGNVRGIVWLSDMAQLMKEITTMFMELDMLSKRVRAKRMKRSCTSIMTNRSQIVSTTARWNTSHKVDELINGLPAVENLSLSELINKQETQVATGIAEVDGIISKSRNINNIKRVVMEHIGAITYAYNQELKANPYLKGKLIIEFTIEHDGTVSRAKVVSSTLESKALEQTILNTSKTLVFDKVKDDRKSITVKYPFLFSSGSLYASNQD